jgi:hypothetical protein
MSFLKKLFGAPARKHLDCTTFGVSAPFGISFQVAMERSIDGEIHVKASTSAGHEKNETISRQEYDSIKHKVLGLRTELEKIEGDLWRDPVTFFVEVITPEQRRPAKWSQRVSLKNLEESAVREFTKIFRRFGREELIAKAREEHIRARCGENAMGRQGHEPNTQAPD